MDFDWAFNKIKLNLAIKDLENAKKIDPTIQIDEDTVKARYELRGGLVLTQEEIASTEPVVVKQKPVIRRSVRGRK